MVRHLRMEVQKRTHEHRKVRIGCTVEQNQQPGRKWYAVLTKPRNEEIAQFHMHLKNINVFYPKLFVPVPTKSGRQVVALFPNYLFVNIDLSSTQYCQVIWCRGVKRLVSFGGMPSAVEDNVIEFIREQADPSGLIIAKSNLKIGDEVQIAKGPFKGLVGIIQEPPDTKSRVRVLMSMLSRHVQVEVPAGYIDMGWVAPCPSV
jgi:transcriptional antiterminator RfaH